MNTHDHDNDALPGEDELKALYRSLPRKEPSPEQDRAIKRAAADAVRASRRRPSTRWPVAVASVAMVVVAAGLGWRMLQQPSSLPQMPASRAVIAKAPAPEPAHPASAPAPQSDMALAAPEEKQTAERAAEAPVQRENIRTALKPKVVAPKIAARQAPVVAAAPAPVPAAAEETMAAAPPPPPAPPAPPAMIVAPPPAPPAPAPAPATADVAVNAPAAAQGYHAAAMRAMAAPPPVLDATTPNPTDTPTQELEKIRQLFAQHRHDEAVQRLTAFRKAHPDTPLPDDLRAQLPDHE
jgi:hypothetical protein